MEHHSNHYLNWGFFALIAKLFCLYFSLISFKLITP